jgi:acyl-CoA dehydrogenase
MSEPASGSDVANMAMTAVRKTVTIMFSMARKTWISNGGIADVYCCLCPHRRSAGRQGTVCVFIVPADTPGLEIAERLDVVAPHPLARLALQQTAAFQLRP